MANTQPLTLPAEASDSELARRQNRTQVTEVNGRSMLLQRDTAAVEWRGMRQSDYCGAAPRASDLTAKRG